MDLSIIIPVYNEESKIARDISDANDFLNRQSLSGEIIVVDDGSLDNTIRIAKETRSGIESPLYVLEYPHRGKGHSVKTGILKAQSDIIMFIDSGGCVPYNNLMQGLKFFHDNECDIAHASRMLPDSKIQGKSKSRHAFSWIFRKLVSWWMKIPGHLTDTQCGLKMYKREVAHTLYRDCLSRGFMFDVEIVLRADKAGNRIKEFPVVWTADPDSRLSIRRNIWGIIRELKVIKRELKK